MIQSLSGAPLLHTAVDARLEAPITPGTNLLYCASFQLAWNELRASLGGSVELQGSPPLALALEEEGPSRADLDDDAYVAGGGVGPSILTKLDRALRSKFGDRDDFMLPPDLPSDAILAYAYLSKDLVFDTPFAYERDIGMPFRRDKRVAYFGVWSGEDEKVRSKRAEQVVVHHAEDDGAFILELVTRTEGDRLILARVSPRPTLLATVDDVMSHANHKPGVWARMRGTTKLGKHDGVRIPMIDVDLLRSFVELAGLGVVGRDYFIQEAKQRIRFKLDEKGAILRSAGVIMALRGGPRGRQYVCDEPFLVLMIRKGCRYPYFALWVEHPELLVAASRAAG